MRHRSSKPDPWPIFVVVLTYTVVLSKIDEALPEHLEWLSRQYDDEVFVASGNRTPRTGRVILAAGLTRDDLELRLNLDPFARLGLATYEVIEFLPSRLAAGMEVLA
jgi:uncharacterized protein YciI